MRWVSLGGANFNTNTELKYLCPGDGVLFFTSSEHPSCAPLIARLIELGEIRSLAIRPSDSLAIRPSDTKEDWTSLTSALAESKFRCRNMELDAWLLAEEAKPAFDAFSATIITSLIANHSLSCLTLGHDPIAATWPLTRAALFALLRARAAPLALLNHGQNDWLDHEHAAEFGQWKCLQQGSLAVESFPSGLLPQPQQQPIRGVRLRQLHVFDATDRLDGIMAFIANNEIEQICVRSPMGGFSSSELSKAFIRACNGRTVTSVIKWEQSSARLWTDASDTLPKLLPNLSRYSDPIDGAQATLLATRSDLWPNLNSVAVFWSCASQLASLLRARPSLTELDIHLSGSVHWIEHAALDMKDNNRDMTKADVDLLSTAIAQTSITRLTLFGTASSFAAFPHILAHPQCGVQFVRMSLSLSPAVRAELRAALLLNNSLQMIVHESPYRDHEATDAVLGEIAQSKPQLLALSALGQALWGQAPPSFQSLMEWQPGRLHEVSEESFEKYRATRAMLRKRQIRYVLLRDSWQRTAFTLSWFRANHQHPLRDSCFALLPAIRELTGGAASGFETAEDSLLGTWYPNEEKEAAELFKGQRLNVQRLVDSRYGQATILQHAQSQAAMAPAASPAAVEHAASTQARPD